MQKISILVLSCGTNACFNFCKQLNKFFPGRFRLVGVDINKSNLVASSPYLDSFYQVFKNIDEEYYTQILNIVSNEKIDFILPSFDRDQKLFYPENEDLKKLGCKSLGSNSEILKFYGDKTKTMKILSRDGFQVPLQISFDEIDANETYFRKPINGVGSIGASIVTGKDLLNCKQREFDDCIVQEVCALPEVTVECFHYKDFFSFRCRERILNKAGVCVKTKIFEDQTLGEITKAFCQKYNPPFVFNIQFMKNSNSQWVITDVNLRFAGGGSLTLASDWNYAAALGSVLLNDDSYRCFVPELSLSAPMYVITTHDYIVTSRSKAKIVIDLDGTLLNSQDRHLVLLEDLLKIENIKLDTSDYLSHKRNGMSTYNWLLTKGIENANALKISRDWKRLIESKEYLKYDKLYDGCANFLLSLSRNFSLILVTARSNEINVKQQLEYLGINGFFESVHVVSPYDGVNCKTQIMSNLQPKYIIGDTETDLVAACSVGAVFLAFSHGFRSEEFLKQKGCSRIYGNFKNLLDYLNISNYNLQ